MHHHHHHEPPEEQEAEAEGEAGMGRRMMAVMGRMRERMERRRRPWAMRCPMCGHMTVGGMHEGPYRGKGPALRSDDQVRTAVEEVLTEDSWLDATDIQVRVENGVVTLSGKVASREAKRRAEDDADMVVGVRDVRNELEIAEAQ